MTSSDDAQRCLRIIGSAGAAAVTRFHLHLVSDSTGDTVHSVARACLVQFEDAEAIEHVWSMVRTHSQIDRVIAGVEANPGVVLFTLVNEHLRQLLQQGCRRLQVPAIPVLDPVIGALASYLGRKSRGLPGQQHLLDSEYFARIDAMTFALNHDDGQSSWGLDDADVVSGRRVAHLEDADLHLSRQSRHQGGERADRAGRAVAARAVQRRSAR